jgi:hypothetical protein
VDFYGAARFDVLCVTDHANRADDPWLTPRERRLAGVHERTFPAYLEEIDAEAERAAREWGLLVLPGLELSYNHVDPLLAAHAVAVGLRSWVTVDHGITDAICTAREQGAAIIAAHPYAPGTGPLHPRTTQHLGAEWRKLARHIDRWELYNRHEAFPWVAAAGLPVIASGDFHRPEHLFGWKTVLPCGRGEREIVSWLQSDGAVYLARVDEAAAMPAATPAAA